MGGAEVGEKDPADKHSDSTLVSGVNTGVININFTSPCNMQITSSVICRIFGFTYKIQSLGDLTSLFLDEHFRRDGTF